MHLSATLFCVSGVILVSSASATEWKSLVRSRELVQQSQEMFRARISEAPKLRGWQQTFESSAYFKAEPAPEAVKLVVA